MTDTRTMAEKTKEASPCSLVVRPPYVVAPDIDVVAFDLTFGASEPIPADAPMLCLGGHPAAECLLGVDGSGQTHQTTMAIDRSSSRHRLMVDRMRDLLDRSVDIQIVDLPNPSAPRSG